MTVRMMTSMIRTSIRPVYLLYHLLVHQPISLSRRVKSCTQYLLHELNLLFHMTELLHPLRLGMQAQHL